MPGQGGRCQEELDGRMCGRPAPPNSRYCLEHGGPRRCQVSISRALSPPLQHSSSTRLVTSARHPSPRQLRRHLSLHIWPSTGLQGPVQIVRIRSAVSGHSSCAPAAGSNHQEFQASGIQVSSATVCWYRRGGAARQRAGARAGAVGTGARRAARCCTPALHLLHQHPSQLH